MRKYNFLDREITLQQEPYLDFAIDENCIRAREIYRALAKDEDGFEYFLDWIPIEDFRTCEDESIICDWDYPICIRMI